MFNTRQFIHKVCALITIISYNKHYAICDVDPKVLEQRYTEAKSIAQSTVLTFITLFDSCITTSMQNFAIDNLQRFILSPARTTIGFMAKYTANRKFFANMIATPAFKEMLNSDVELLRKHYVQKMKYCEQAVMDHNLLKDFYDREVDQSKLK